MTKTIQDYDNELEELNKRHAHSWGLIQQCRAQRNLALTQYARANTQSEPARAVQLATWNSNGHNNFNFEEVLP